MKADTVVIERSLLESLINENERLKAKVAEYESNQLQPQVMERQISIEEWQKTQKPLTKSLKPNQSNKGKKGKK